MNSLPTQAILGVGAAALAVAATLGSIPLAISLVSVAAAIAALVAFSAQSERLRAEEHLVYRPVYVRRHDVRRRARLDD